MALRHPPTLALSLLALAGCKGCQDKEDGIGDEPNAIEDSGNNGGEGSSGDGSDGGEPAWDHDWGRWLSMGVMPDGSPAIAWYDGTDEALGFAIGSLSGSSVTWTREEVDGYKSEDGLDSGDRGLFTSMAVGADGTVWVAYQDVDDQAVRFARRDNSGAWTTGLVDAGSGEEPGAGHFISLALDGSGWPVVVHHDEDTGTLRVAHFNSDSSTFTSEVVDAGSPGTASDGSELPSDVGEFARIRVYGGVEYITYYDRANGDLKMAWGTAGAYTVETVYSEGDVGLWSDLQVVDGALRISWQDNGNQDLYYSSGSPGSWTHELVDAGNLVGADTALFTNGSYPAILYFDGFESDMKMAWRTSDGWQTSTVESTDEALGYHNEVVTAGGSIYVACYNYTTRTPWFAPLD